MKLIKVESYETPAAYLAGLINGYLAAEKKVLWFLSGGSSVDLAVASRKLLDDEGLHRLVVMLIDERYGPVGHPGSNWQKLAEAGFNFGKLKAIAVLSGKPIADTTDDFEANLKREFKSAGVAIGLMGIGSDGHTSGILLDSPALKAKGLATHYQGADFSRITTTPKALSMLDEVVTWMSGEAKRPIIEGLHSLKPVEVMPSQLLKINKKWLLFNDQIGEKI